MLGCPWPSDAKTRRCGQATGLDDCGWAVAVTLWGGVAVYPPYPHAVLHAPVGWSASFTRTTVPRQDELLYSDYLLDWYKSTNTMVHAPVCGSLSLTSTTLPRREELLCSLFLLYWYTSTNTDAEDTVLPNTRRSPTGSIVCFFHVAAAAQLCRVLPAQRDGIF